MLGWVNENGYYLFMGLGAVSMTVLLVLRRNRFRIKIWQASVLSIILLGCGILGAKGLFYLENPELGFSGMSFFGSVFLVMLAMPVIGKLFSLDTKETLDACAPCVASIIAFTRFGCFLAGCCGGKMAWFLGKVFFWPTQLIESFGDLAILVFLLHLEQEHKLNGRLYSVFLVLYSPMRFLVEFMRDTPKDWLGMSHGQWFSIAGLVIGSLILWKKRGE